MAILTTPKIKAEILINSVPLQEYDDDDDDHGEQACENTITKYVEAQSGQEFAIRCCFDYRPKHSVKVKYLLDGRCVPGRFFRLRYFRGSSLARTSYGVSSNEGGIWQVSKYKFAQLTTVTSEGQSVAAPLMKDLKHMGKITLEFHYVNHITKTNHIHRLPKSSIPDGVPEKALKGQALSHKTTFGEPKPVAARKSFNCKYIDHTRKPFATFHFKYRSRNALKALMVIPRSPSPIRLEDRDVDTLSLDEMRELLRRQRAKDQATRAVKQEHGVKRERSTERGSTTNRINGDDNEDVSFVSAKRRRHAVILNEDSQEVVDLT